MTLPARKIDGKKASVFAVVKKAEGWVVSQAGEKAISESVISAQNASKAREKRRQFNAEDLNNCIVNL